VVAELILFPPAKINLYLRILGRRPDGYHEIDTLMQKLDLTDRLQIRLAGEGVTLECPGSGLPCDAGNLVYRAAEKFLAAAGVRHGVHMVLEKRIPVAAGLGGGSSDAAAVLVGLNRLLATGFSEARLRQMGRELGADVPFFVRQQPAAWAGGIGDLLEDAPSMRACWVLLVNPGFPVSTKWVYENFALTTKGNPYKVGRELYSGSFSASPDGKSGWHMWNDLESVTREKYPELLEIEKKLRDGGAIGAMMSGSGPTVFGIFNDLSLAEAGLQGFKLRYGEQVFLTKPLLDI